MVLKAELHCHIEGAAAPRIVQAKARQYGVDVSAIIDGDHFVWHDFTSFITCYDTVASLFRTPGDYADLAEHYLTSIALQGAIYSEIFISPDHAQSAGLSSQAYVDGLGEGMARAKAATGIEGRMIVVGVRHLGAEAVEAAARFAASRPHPLVTGFGMAGEERYGKASDFARAYDIARAAGLGLTVHAGELAGWESVADALDALKPSRIGHGVRAIENPDLVKRLAGDGIVLECCPASNIALHVFESYADHPFPKLRAAGIPVTLNSDDPPYFSTDLANEYRIGADCFGLDEDALSAVTKTAIEAAFVDKKTRDRLLGRLAGQPVATKL